jgi:hypothetical protein
MFEPNVTYKTSRSDLAGLSIGRHGQHHAAVLLRQYQRFEDTGGRYWNWPCTKWWQVEELQVFDPNLAYDQIAEGVWNMRGAVNYMYRYRNLRIDADRNSEVFTNMRTWFQKRGHEITIHPTKVTTDSRDDDDAIRQYDLLSRLLYGLQRKTLMVPSDFGSDWLQHGAALNAAVTWRHADDSYLAASLALGFWESEKSGHYGWMAGRVI